MTMIKKALMGTTVLFGVAALSGAASADVFVTGTITKDKDKRVVERIVKDKDVTVTVTSTHTLVGGAESESLGNQRNENNALDHNNDADPNDDQNSPLNTFEAEMDNSVRGNDGVTQVNQDVGNMTNQGNVLAVSIVAGSDKFADAQGSAEQQNNDNEVFERGSLPLTPDNADRSASITASINGNVGVTQVNQNAGAMNNQLNAVSLALGDGSAVALSEADLGQFNSGNKVDSVNTVKTGTVRDSVNNNTGVTNVNQSTGNFNNQGTVISFSGSASLGG